MKLSKAIAQFVAEKQLARLPSTARAYEGDLAYLVKFAAKDSIQEFDEALLVKTFGVLKQRGLVSTSLYRKATSFREFARWGVRKGLWAKDPMQNPAFDFKLRRGVPRPFETGELARLMALPLDGVEPVVRALLLYSGLRVTPIARLRVDDVSFSPMRAETPQGRVEVPGTIRSVGKGDKALLTPLAPELAPILSSWLRENPGKRPYDPLLHGRSGRPLRAETIERMTRKWGERAQVPNCTPHRWRHTFASDLVQRSVPIQVVQKLLGHASIATTMVYCQVGDAQQIEAMLRRGGA